MVEVWHDKAALDAHAAAVGGLRDKLQPLFASPLDIRTNSGLAVAGPAIGAEPGAGNAVYVLTHVDVFPAGKDQTIEFLRQLAEASRKESGNLRFDVLQQDGRLNHLPLVEAWHDAGAPRARDSRAHPRLPGQAGAVAGRALRRAALHAGPLSRAAEERCAVLDRLAL
jgi:quinol monooxygenase YgiN